MDEKVILVDSSDHEKGTMGKEQAHREGRLHRAFSVFLFNDKGELLLQRRAEGKYHSGGLWTNTCCSHPRPGESTEAAAVRRTKEEMGIDASVKKLFDFVYFCPLGPDLFEYEFDHVFVGISNAVPLPDPSEVMEAKWVDPIEIAADLDANPNNYTFWFQLIFKDVIAKVKTI
jgi:isopentenyl-diphosphate delta-isomerase